MTCNPIGIPLLIARAKNADNGRECLELWPDLLAALEQAQAEIESLTMQRNVFKLNMEVRDAKLLREWKREKGRADAAETKLAEAQNEMINAIERARSERHVCESVEKERDSARAENARLREALGDLVAEWLPGQRYNESPWPVVEMKLSKAREALAATKETTTELDDEVRRLAVDIAREKARADAAEAAMYMAREEAKRLREAAETVDAWLQCARQCCPETFRDGSPAMASVLRAALAATPPAAERVIAAALAYLRSTPLWRPLPSGEQQCKSPRTT